MRKIPSEQIEAALEKAVISANISLGADIIAMLRKARKDEENELASKTLEILIENAELALKRKTPLCQDTGVAVIFVSVGENVFVEGKSLKDAIEEGVRRGYTRGSLRSSLVASPFDRKNTGDNTPPMIHIDITKGDRLIIDFLAKGGGCENKSALRMLTPADGEAGIKKFVVDTVRKAGAAACPPFFIGVGVGGNFETCAILAKKALLREPGRFHGNPRVKQLESELLDAVNKLNIGPLGFGGGVTAFFVAVEEAPCHIASLPVAVNIDCHSHRHRRIEL